MTPTPSAPSKRGRGVLLWCVGLGLLAATLSVTLLADGSRWEPRAGQEGVRPPNQMGDSSSDRAAGTEQDGDALSIMVDNEHPAASDEGPGNAERPLSTLGQALRVAASSAEAGRPVVIHVAPGIYRESLEVDAAAFRAPVTIAGAGPDETIVDGSDTWSGWEEDERTGLFSHPWPYEWGVADLPGGGWETYFERNEVSDVVRRSEAIWVDDVVLRQVLTSDEAEDTPGSFAVDEDAGRLLVNPLEGTTLEDATVAVAVRRRLLDVDGANGFTVRNLGFRRAATPLQEEAARFRSSQDILIDRARFSWNSWGGLAVQQSNDVTLRDVSLDHNGVQGLSVWRSTDLHLVNVANSYNNTWRGRWAGYFGWANGAKFYSVRRVQIDRWTAVGNDANGLWLDTDVADVHIVDSYIADNLRRGVFLEALQGPVAVTGTTICNNGGPGIVDGKAIGVTLEGNRIVGNGDAQLLFSGSRGGRDFTTFDTDDEVTVLSRDWVVRGNTFGASGGARLVGNHLNDAEWELLLGSLTFFINNWYHPTDPRPFALPGRVVSFTEWQDETGSGDRFTAEHPAGGCRPPSAAPDG